MPRPNHALLVAALAALTLTASTAATELVAPAAQAASASTHLLSCTGQKLTRPRGNVVLACADANLEIHGTHWSSWTAAVASGTTTLDINLCNPTCVKSKMSSFPDSSVRLSGVRRSPAGLVFSRATITYKHAGKDATVTAYPRT
jgi:hypothetical protein